MVIGFFCEGFGTGIIYVKDGVYVREGNRRVADQGGR
jgi:hypothetical protein